MKSILESSKMTPRWPDTPLDVKPGIEFTREHKTAWEKIGKGHNVLIVGPGGTGKSMLIQFVYKQFIRMRKSIYVVATTGTAACNLDMNASTLHSWFGARDSLSPENVVSSLSKKSLARLMDTQVLIIDEVSMLPASFFSLINKTLQIVRKSSHPMGGIQVVFFGDFLQLPPVESSMDTEKKHFSFPLLKAALAAKEKDTKTSFEKIPLSQKRLFELEEFQNMIGNHVVVLTKIFRQTDTVFSELLMRTRKGQLTQLDKEVLRGRIRKPHELLLHCKQSREKDPQFVEPVYLHPRNKEVLEWNEMHMNRLQGEESLFETIFRVKLNNHVPEKTLDEPPEKKDILFELLMKQFAMPNEIILKEGAQVILVRNIHVPSKLVNGSCGVIMHIGDEPPIQSGYQRWISLLSVDLVDSIMRLVPGRSGCPLVWVKFASLPCPIPIGRYIWKAPVNPSDLSLPEEKWNSYACAEQVPLLLAWAITIHKSQSYSLDSAYLYLGKDIKTPGQAYTAISRVRDLQGLYIREFDPNCFISDPVCLQFDNFLLSSCVDTHSSGSTTSSTTTAPTASTITSQVTASSESSFSTLK